MRPQLIRHIANTVGYAFDSSHEPDSAFSILDELYEDDVIYEEVRSLFIGLFSRTANNVVISNYTELKYDMLDSLHNDPERDKIYEVLFIIHIITTKAVESVSQAALSQEIKDIFQRFWKDEKYGYRAFLTLLALAYATNIKIFDPQNRTYPQFVEFITSARKLLN